MKTYTFKIKPNKKIEQKFYQWIGVCRYVYNVSKEVKEESHKYGLKLTSYDIQKQLTDAKKEHLFLKEVHSQTLQSVIERMDNAFKRFFKGAGYPKWASKKKWKSIPFKSVNTTHNAFKLPSFGVVKVFKFKEPKGNLKTATIIEEADGLYLKVVVDEKKEKQQRENQSVVAIDMGISYFMTTSDGEFFDNPKHLFNQLTALRIENRKLSRMKKGGSNYKKQVKVLGKLYQKIKRVRKDFLHKKSRYLANNFDIIIREDLDISKMVKKSSFAKHILDCSWSEFFNFLEYKVKVLKVNPAYSSQCCNKCKHVDKNNRKTQSLFECIRCGHTDNADLNAAFNLLERGRTLMEANVDH